MTTYALGALKRGDSLTFEVELDVTVTREGVDVEIDDLTDWDPVCQFRHRPDGTAVYEPELLAIEGKVCRFGISNALSASMVGDFRGEVQLTDPEADEGYGDITWPGEGYLTLSVERDVVRVVAS